MSEIAEETQGAPASRRRLRAALLVIVALALAITFPRHWGAAAAGRIARHYLDLDEPGSSSCTVDSISPFGLSAHAIRLGSVAGKPEISRLRARYTPWGLLRGNITSVGVSLAADFSGELSPAAADALPDARAEASLELRRFRDSGYRASVSGRLFGGPLSGSGSGPTLTDQNVSLAWTPELRNCDALPQLRLGIAAALSAGTGVASRAASATFRLSAEGLPWHAEGEARAEAGGFAFSAALPDGSFHATDPLVAPLLRAFAPTGLAVRALAGSITGTVSCARAPGAAVPLWNCGVRAFGINAEGSFGETDFSVSGARAWLPVEGFGPHFDIKPFGILFDSADVGKFAFGRGSFWFRSDLKTLLLTEGSLGFCGGAVRVYALHFDPERLNAGFTLLLDNIDAGQFLAFLPGVKGTATGRLYGKLPLSLRDGRTVHLRNAFLYSPPGEVGRLELTDSSVIIDNLAQAGIPDETCRNLAVALSSLDYTAARLDLTQNRDGTGRLAVKLEGTGGPESTRVPVKLELAFNGELEEVLNTGIRAVAP